MLKKIAAIALMGGLFMASCKKKEIENTTPSAVSSNQEAAHIDSLPHVCVEKSLPVSQQRTEAAIYTSSQWPIGQTIRIKFINGDATLQKRVQNAAALWLQFANLKFQYVTATE